MRLTEEDGMVSSLRSYGFCPEVMREVPATGVAKDSSLRPYSDVDPKRTL